ncbi:MAG: ABC transporter ATP-binding protein [Pseudomonadales bacterium]|jgi:glycerol transport system ATP-binding protein|nr:ABC transporter ATP-binding protein [Pseudomonadales bacterium]
MANIILDELGFAYPGALEPTLLPLSVEIKDGEAFALLGASGAGKTTLLNLLSGLLVPTTGRILFNGVDVSSQSGSERNLAQVFQFPVLYESLTIADNLAFPLRARKAVNGFSAVDIASRVAKIAGELEIENLLKRKPKTLSLFQKQLVAIGRALMRPDVSVVLLDEPLTAVEPRTKWQLRQSLKRLQEELGVTMIYVTHDQTEALTFADRVAVMADGKILQTASPQEVYEQPAHEFVGFFIGSPGMNFVAIDSAIPAPMYAASGVDQFAQRIGFRPEWARLEHPPMTHPLSAVHWLGRVTHCQILGTQDGVPVGITTLASEVGELKVRGAINATVGEEIMVVVDRCVSFCAEHYVATHYAQSSTSQLTNPVGNE